MLDYRIRLAAPVNSKWSKDWLLSKTINGNEHVSRIQSQVTSLETIRREIGNANGDKQISLDNHCGYSWREQIEEVLSQAEICLVDAAEEYRVLTARVDSLTREKQHLLEVFGAPNMSVLLQNQKRKEEVHRLQEELSRRDRELRLVRASSLLRDQLRACIRIQRSRSRIELLRYLWDWKSWTQRNLAASRASTVKLLDCVLRGAFARHTQFRSVLFERWRAMARCESLHHIDRTRIAWASWFANFMDIEIRRLLRRRFTCWRESVREAMSAKLREVWESIARSCSAINQHQHLMEDAAFHLPADRELESDLSSALGLAEETGHTSTSYSSWVSMTKNPV